MPRRDGKGPVGKELGVGMGHGHGSDRGRVGGRELGVGGKAMASLKEEMEYGF